jgi:uncharacterized protein with GYD domain
MLLNWTDQGVRNAKETVKRAAAARQAFEKAGAKISQVLWTLGSHDLLLIVEAPDDQTITALGIQLAMHGNVRTSTLRAFDEREMEQILSKV